MRIVKIKKNGTITIADFNPVQAYKIAVKTEEDGIAFYSGLLNQVRDAEAQKEIGFLIEQEQEHLKTFGDLLDQEKEVTQDSFEEDDIVNYMKSHVFDASLEKTEAQKMSHRHTALEEAMSMERRSIVFYEACLANAKEPKAVAAFKKILEEENKHLRKFADLLRIKCINSQEGCLL